MTFSIAKLRVCDDCYDCAQIEMNSILRSYNRNVVENLVESHLALEEEENPELHENLIVKGQKDVEKDLKVLQDKYLVKKKFLLGDKRKTSTVIYCYSIPIIS